ncbi:MAG: hypothetical protein ABFS32_07125, partial [Bacteroidota bacterium]
NKSPDLYGAFPTDAYSHTPGNAGVQQPGMTGQVKEDIISRWAELGVVVKDGQITLNPVFLKKEEFIQENAIFSYFDINNQKQSIELMHGSLAFTYCQVPVIYKLAERENIEIVKSGNKVEVINNNTLSGTISKEIFNRSGLVKQVQFNCVIK